MLGTQRCPKSCLLEVLGGSRLDLVACEPQQGEQSLFTKIDNDQNHDHFQPSDLLATLSPDLAVNSGPQCCEIETVPCGSQEAWVLILAHYSFLCAFAKANSFCRAREEKI